MFYGFNGVFIFNEAEKLFYEIDVVGARRAGLGAILLDPSGVNSDRDCDRVSSLDELAERLGA